MKKIARVLVSASLLCLPLLAMAAPSDVRLRSNVNLRSGPDADYPRVSTLRAGSRLDVHGCLRDWSWCDVSSNGRRGWISASYLDVNRNGRRVALSRGGDGLGFAVLDFLIGDYWDSHYRGQSWYGQRPQYERRYPQHSGPRPGTNNARPGAPGQNRPGQSANPVPPRPGQSGTPQPPPGHANPGHKPPAQGPGRPM